MSRIMSKSIDAHIKPPTVGFNRTRNIEKAAYILKGIVDGVNVDDNLVDAEILYLDAWMRGRNSLDLQVVAFDLYQAVNRVLEDQCMTHHEPTDLNELIQNTLKCDDENRTPDDELHINEFLSMLKTICANGIIIQSKVTRVEAWVTANRDISKAFPIKPVYYRIHDAVKDAVKDTVKNGGEQVKEELAKELAKLDELVTEISSDSKTQTGDDDRGIGQVFCDDDEHLSFV